MCRSLVVTRRETKTFLGFFPKPVSILSVSSFTSTLRGSVIRTLTPFGIREGVRLGSRRPSSESRVLQGPSDLQTGLSRKHGNTSSSSSTDTSGGTDEGRRFLLVLTCYQFRHFYLNQVLTNVILFSSEFHLVPSEDVVPVTPESGFSSHPSRLRFSYSPS